MKKILNHPLFTGSMVMIIGSNAINFLNYLYHLIMGRLLGPANYGELAALISLMGLFSIVPSSINLVIIKYVSSAKSEAELAGLINWLRVRVVKVSIVFFIAILIATPFITSFLHISKIAYLILFAVTFLIGFQSLFYRSILQGLLKFKETVISILAENSIKLLVSVLLIYFGFRVGGAIFAFLIAVMVGWFITIFYLKIKTKKADQSPDVKSMAFFAIPVIIQSFAMTSIYSSDVILVKHFFSSHDAGIYAALSTLGKIILFATGPIGSVMFPLVSKRMAKGENYKRVFMLSFAATAFLSGAILLVYFLFPSLAIKLLYGSLFLEAAGLLVWFGIFIACFTLSFLIVSYNLSLGKTKVVIFPAVAALTQIILIWIYHQSLFTVILISIIISALLLAALFIYSIYETRSHAKKIDFSHSAGV